jgi:hypothetical protein
VRRPRAAALPLSWNIPGHATLPSSLDQAPVPDAGSAEGGIIVLVLRLTAASAVGFSRVTGIEPRARKGEMHMKKRYWLTAFAMALSITSGAAMAANISNLSGQSCGDATGTWHFVNNQTGGAAAGILNASWSSGNTCTVSPSSVLQNTQHFNCTASGTLLTASTNLPGRLVLSDFSCGDIKEPPPCDPKKEICEEPPKK